MITWAFVGVAIVLLYCMHATRDWDSVRLQMDAVIILGLLAGANLNFISTVIETFLHGIADLR